MIPIYIVQSYSAAEAMEPTCKSIVQNSMHLAAQWKHIAVRCREFATVLHVGSWLMLHSETAQCMNHHCIALLGSAVYHSLYM